MPASNRRRHANVIPIFSLASWFVLFTALGCGGIYYVNFKNQLLSRGTQIRELEKKLTDLRNENEHAQTEIDKLASPNALRTRWAADKRLLAGYIPIPQASLVLYPVKEPAAGDLRPVANEKR